MTWPTAFEDILGYSLWPGQYAERIRSHGIGAVIGVIFTPMPRSQAQAPLTQGENDRSDALPSGPCAALPASPDWPTRQIEREVELNDRQREALSQLKTAIGKAVAAIKTACRDEAALPPHERLRVMQNTLWVVHETVISLRPPLTAFYEALTDDQRKKFATPATANIDLNVMNPTAIARTCGAPASGNSLFRQIDLVLKPSPALRASLDVFQKRLTEMGQFLMASCLRPVPSTPAERLDAATDKLTALTFAASTVNLALNDVYAQLTDEQKARFSPSR